MLRILSRMKKSTTMPIFNNNLMCNNHRYGVSLQKMLETKLNESKLNQLKIQYKLTPNLSIFKQYITTNTDYFKLFQLAQNQPYSQQMYQDLRTQTQKLIPQNDNMLLLRGRISARIAQNYSKLGKNKEALQKYNEALQIFQTSMVPQVMQYYSVYRKYGLFLASIDKKEQAKSALSESVQILKQFVKHSEDPLKANYHSIQQAKSCVQLIYLDPQNREKWLSMANNYWKECQSGVYDNIQYAQTVYENTVDKIKINPKKAKLYAQVQMDKITNQIFHQIINKAFKNTIKQQNKPQIIIKQSQKQSKK